MGRSQQRYVLLPPTHLFIHIQSFPLFTHPFIHVQSLPPPTHTPTPLGKCLFDVVLNNCTYFELAILGVPPPPLPLPPPTHHPPTHPPTHSPTQPPRQMPLRRGSDQPHLLRAGCPRCTRRSPRRRFHPPLRQQGKDLLPPTHPPMHHSTSFEPSALPQSTHHASTHPPTHPLQSSPLLYGGIEQCLAVGPMDEKGARPLTPDWLDIQVTHPPTHPPTHDVQQLVHRHKPPPFSSTTHLPTHSIQYLIQTASFSSTFP